MRSIYCYCVRERLRFYFPIYTPVKYRKTFITVSILCLHKYAFVKPNALKVNVLGDKAELYNNIHTAVYQTCYPYKHFCITFIYFEFVFLIRIFFSPSKVDFIYIPPQWPYEIKYF